MPPDEHDIEEKVLNIIDKYGLKLVNFPLMKNNILPEDLDAISYLQQEDPILTNNAKVKSLKKNGPDGWVKYSVFVNSGSSANFVYGSVKENSRWWGSHCSPIDMEF